MNNQDYRSSGSGSSLKLAVISTFLILLVFGGLIGGFYVYKRLPEKLAPVKGNFFENFNDGKIDERLVILTNGGTKHSIEKGVLFFDQTDSPRDAHMWYYNEPLDFTRPFTIRMRVKTANYVASAVQGCCPLILRASETEFPALYPGGRTAHPDEVLQVVLHGAERGFAKGVERTGVGVHDGPQWNFKDKKWLSAKPDWYDIAYPYPPAEFITLELHSTPENFYIKWRDKNGKSLYVTSPLSWKKVEKIKGDKKVYLCGGEQLTSWWSNDQWIDFIEIKYER